jgi:multidrug efflux pump subunit AcrA (membrane-fusion protein)
MSVASVNKSAKTKSGLLTRFLALSLWKKGIIVVVLLAIIWFLGTRLFGQKSTTSQYQTATAQKGNIVETVDESGNVNASSQTEVTSPANGLVQQIFVKNGEHVTAGQKLFTVKSTATPEEKASAYSSYESALASYNSANQAKQALVSALEVDRQNIITASQNVYNMQISGGLAHGYTQDDIDLLNSKYTSAQEAFSADETKYDQEDTAIAAAQANLNAASLNYQATQNATVTAPIAGTVANLAVMPGDVVTASTVTTTSNSTSFSSSSSSSTNNGSTVLVIGNLSQLSVIAQVNEVDVPNIKPGQEATVTLDAFPNQTFVGKVQSVDSIGTISSGVVTYNVYITLISPPSEVKAGMSASIAIQTAHAYNVITVPSAAIQTANGASYVRVLKNGQVTSVPVTTGISDDTNTQITSGISAGETVVVGTNATTNNTTSPFSSGGFGGSRGGFGGGGGGGVIIRSGGGGGARGG